ncbi:MAG: hypothetical protein HY366_00935 [Candidatus Aenigmarchaeota archaeon]|nr:hypothetical protein [Candidatus Aenigmarchaeota archaeon]
MTLVVKRRGHREAFDERKLYASVYAACASAHYNEAGCERAAAQMTARVKSIVKGRKEINSKEIRSRVKEELGKIDENVEFFYDKHLPNLKKL